MRPLARAACCCCDPQFCQHIGRACEELNHSCQSCSQCFGGVIESFRGSIANFFCPHGKPSPIFLVYTAIFNLIPGILHLTAGIWLLRRSCHSDCDMGLVKFLFGTVAVNAFFMLFAIHINQEMRKPYTAPTPEERSPLKRAWDVVMDDPWVSVCVLVVIACIPTIFVGFTWDLEGSCPCDPEFPARVGGAAFALLFYLLGAGFVACISLAVETWRHRDAETDDPYPPQRSLLSMILGGPIPDASSPHAFTGGAAPVPVSGPGLAAYLDAMSGARKPLKGEPSTSYGSIPQGSSSPGAGYGAPPYAAPTPQPGFYPNLSGGPLVAPKPYDDMKPGKTVG